MFALEKEGLLDRLVFQGGSAFSTDNLMSIKGCLENYIGRRYGLEITVKEPSETKALPELREIKVDKWQVRVTTEPARKDLPKQKVKIEVANIAAYTKSPQSLKINYDFLPDGYDNILMMCEDLDEIMADKLISLVACQQYVRHRDIWDLRWLSHQGAVVRPGLILDKIKDYQLNDYGQKLNHTIDVLSNIIHGKKFHDEMSRFIPMDIQKDTLKKQKFLDHLVEEDRRLLREVQKILS